MCCPKCARELYDGGHHGLIDGILVRVSRQRTVDCFDRTGVIGSQVCFEVTESSVLSNIKHARRFIGVLHGMGCRFALDDFGSGMGSFSSLRNLAMDYLKIDGSLTRDLAANNAGAIKTIDEEFMRAAERYSLMPAVDRWVVQTRFAALSSGALRAAEEGGVSINLSGQTLGDPGFLEFVVDCFDRTGVIGSQVCFEVTESSVLSNIKHARRFIGVLHGMGCRFALDDFGSGMGSFSSLRNLAMDYLKIDGSLTRDLYKDSVNQAMVAAVIKLASTLGIHVIAEQVEDARSLAMVRDMGAHFAQGFVLGRPQPLQALH